MGLGGTAEASVMGIFAMHPRFFCAFALAGALAACAGSQDGTAARAARLRRASCLRSREAAGRGCRRPAKTGELIYTADYDLNEVFVLSSSTGTLVGNAFGIQSSLGLCADRSGNVFVTDGDRIVEYAHGASQSIATLSYPGASATDCSVDPKSGNLAVTNFSDQSVAIFPKAAGTATVVPTNISAAAHCAYDDKGNLYVDEGNPYEGGIVLEELRAKRTAFMTIQKGIGPSLGPLQWHDGYLLYNTPTISTLKIAGGHMGVSGTTLLAGTPRRDLGGSQFSVQNGNVVVPFGIDMKHPTAFKIGIWRYPSGRFVKAFGNFGAEALSGLAISKTP